MQGALDRLGNDDAKQTWLTDLDPKVRPTALAIVAKIQNGFRAYSDSFNATSMTPTASTRVASLAMGLARDCNDIIGLLGPLTDENVFRGGTAVYGQLKADLTTLANLLTEQITPEQARTQAVLGPISGSASGNGQNSISLSPPVLQSTSTTFPVAYQSAASPPYSQAGEQYMDQTYQRELHQPGSPEWSNEVQNAIAWGLRNGGLSTLVDKLQQERHSPQFVSAVQQAWVAKGLPSLSPPPMPSGVAGMLSASSIKSPLSPPTY